MQSAKEAVNNYTPASNSFDNLNISSLKGMKVTLRQLGPGMIQQLQTQCPVCYGEGQVIDKKDQCKACQGTGTHSSFSLLRAVCSCVVLDCFVLVYAE